MKAAVRAAEGESKESTSSNDILGKDILSLLVRANMAKDTPESGRLTDDEVIARE